MSKRDQLLKRKQWRINFAKYREKNKINKQTDIFVRKNTPPDSPYLSPDEIEVNRIETPQASSGR